MTIDNFKNFFYSFLGEEDVLTLGEDSEVILINGTRVWWINDDDPYNFKRFEADRKIKDVLKK